MKSGNLYQRNLYHRNLYHEKWQNQREIIVDLTIVLTLSTLVYNLFVVRLEKYSRKSKVLVLLPMLYDVVPVVI